MTVPGLTLRSIDLRTVSIPLKRPVVSKVGLFDRWPLVLIDLHTEEGIVGRSYLEPYLERSMRYHVPAIRDVAEVRTGRPIAPLDDFATGRAGLNLIGLEGLSMITVSGLDMAAWDALAKAAAARGLSRWLARARSRLQRLWLTPADELGEQAVELVTEGGFQALKLRLGRERLVDDIAAIRTVRGAVGGDVKLMVDFNRGLSLGDALHRCHALDDQGLYWFEEPIAHDNLAGYAQLTRELETPVQLGENFCGPRALFQAVRAGAGDYVMPDLMRIGGVTGWLRAAAIAGAAGRGVDPPVSGSRGASDARD
jgi:mandelate racemase